LNREKSEKIELISEIEELKKLIDTLQNDSSASSSQLLMKIKTLEQTNKELEAKLRTMQNQLKQANEDKDKLKLERDSFKTEAIDLEKRLS